MDVERRKLMLEASAAQSARDWTRRWLHTLASDGRPIEGGWPGTLPEARACVAADAGTALRKLSMPALTREELSHLTRLTYDQARRLWRSSAG